MWIAHVWPVTDLLTKVSVTDDRLMGASVKQRPKESEQTASDVAE